MSNYGKKNLNSDNFDVDDIDAIEEIFSSKNKPPVKKQDDIDAINEIFSNKNKVKHNDMAEINRLSAKRSRIPNRKISYQDIEEFSEDKTFEKVGDDYGDNFDWQTGEPSKNYVKKQNDNTIVFDKNNYNDNFSGYDNNTNQKNNYDDTSSQNNNSVENENKKIYVLVIVLSVIILILTLALVLTNCKKTNSVIPQTVSSSAFATKQRVTVQNQTKSTYIQQQVTEIYNEETEEPTHIVEVETTEEIIITQPTETQQTVATQAPTEFYFEPQTTISVIEEPTQEHSEAVVEVEETTEQIV